MPESVSWLGDLSPQVKTPVCYHTSRTPQAGSTVIETNSDM